MTPRWTWPWLALPIVLLATTGWLTNATADDLPKTFAHTTPRTDSFGDPLPEEAVARLGTTRLRHSGLVRALAFSSTGKLLASAGDDGCVYLWDAASGRQIRRLLSGESVRNLRFTPDEKSLLVWPVADPGAEAGVAALLDVATEREVRRFDKDLPERYFIACSTDGRVLLIAHDNEHPDPEGNGAITIEKVFYLYDVTAGRHPRRLSGGSGRLGYMVLSPDGALLAAEGQNAVIVRETATGREVRRFPMANLPDNTLNGFTPDGRSLAMSDGQGCRILEVATGKGRPLITGKRSSYHQVLFAPAGDMHAALDHFSVKLADSKSGSSRDIPAPRGVFCCAAFSPDGKCLATGGSDHVIRLWDVDTGRERLAFPGPGGTVGVEFLQDGRTLVSTSMGEATGLCDMSLWEVPSLARRPLPVVRERLVPLALSPDGKWIAAADFGAAHLIDVASGHEVRSSGQGIADYWPLQARFSPDGRFLAVVSDEEPPGTARLPLYRLRLWKVATGKEIWRAGESSRMSMILGDFSPDGAVLTLRYGDYLQPTQISLLDVMTGIQRPLPSGRQILGRWWVFTQDGKTLAAWGAPPREEQWLGLPTPGESSDPGKGLVLWEMYSGEIAFRLTPPGGAVSSACLMRDGRFLIVGLEDGPIVLWDIACRREVRRYLGHRGAVTSLELSAGDRWLVSGSADTTALVWDMSCLASALAPISLSPGRLRELWADLEGGTESAWRARCEFVAAQGQAVSFLRTCLKPVAPGSGDRVERLLADLDSDSFKVRESAQAELLRRAAVPELRQALNDKLSPEARRRVEFMLENLPNRAPAPPLLRELRAVQVLEQIGDGEARKLLRDLAGGTPKAWLTREAEAALDRLARRATSP
jgi:WD40 repeat protein